MQQNDTGGGFPVPPALARLAAETAACLRFFTRLPVPRLGPLDDPSALPDFAVIARAMPLAGAVLATGPALLWLVLQLTALPPLASAALVVAALVALTGALHEDGLGDIADGFFGGATRERRLEIMKDSRIGAFAAIALALSLILKVALLAVLPDRFGLAGSALLLVATEALSRGLALWQWAVLPAARPDGLAARFGVPGRGLALRGNLLAGLVLLPLVWVVPLTGLALGLVAAALVAHAAGRLAFAKIGGFTGDVIGAVQQLAALAFLIGVLMLP
ncbi:adenosylcobinamide-GDP ribazoletransferase [Microvirga tunisiensis]|uniref:Adenosylcobinamide-GDP ribazoletransferase n=2 Tax=Pannonibacter tanglangensis TaxID=2750084 RepID=A0ABW9ZH24_9HYPH|nr:MULTISPECIES: adenosylcobinamide-GDP ribazoletransferase [unclassified Pannonibacter]NBN62459.1 adenosylcobinamide-GDP ribazoletransferase [Pannonibacter sp. XCT-34]NBN78115.1 adenosylcobinamide-GDP ribazoletransferase [Pannonibacter sp. XCT-53]